MTHAQEREDKTSWHENDDDIPFATNMDDDEEEEERDDDDDDTPSLGPILYNQSRKNRPLSNEFEDYDDDLRSNA